MEKAISGTFGWCQINNYGSFDMALQPLDSGTRVIPVSVGRINYRGNLGRGTHIEQSTALSYC